MQPIIFTKLNPAIEILGLIYMSQNPNLLGNANFVGATAKSVLSDEERYQIFGGILSRYVAAFEKKVVINEADKLFFTEADFDFLFCVQLLFAIMPEWIDKIESIPESEIAATLISGLREGMVDGLEDLPELPTTAEIVHALTQSGQSPNVCWKLLQLIGEPKQQLTHFVQIVRKNLPAYEAALLAVKKPLAKRMELFEKARGNAPQSKVSEIAEQLEKKPIHTVVPMLVYPGMEIAGEGYNYVGLFMDDIFQMVDKRKEAQHSSPILKVIGDSSKFEILMALKQAPKYNLELAKYLGLSAGTVSHHMQILIIHGLVSLERRDGRVYYKLEKGPIRDLVSGLQMAFDM